MIFAEQYIQPDNLSNKNNLSQDGEELLTYKFMCFDGEPKIMYVTVKNNDIWENYYDMNFSPLNIRRRYRHSFMQIKKPSKWDEMIDIARKLSTGIPHVRIDLYYTHDNIYFSEYTFYDWGGRILFEPEEWEEKLGEWIKIP